MTPEQRDQLHDLRTKLRHLLGALEDVPCKADWYMEAVAWATLSLYGLSLEPRRAIYDIDDAETAVAPKKRVHDWDSLHRRQPRIA